VRGAARATRPVSEGALRGCRILLTRPPERARSLIARLAELGAEVEAAPTIALEPASDLAPARLALAEIHGYDWIVFTSVNGVRFFRELRQSLALAGEGTPLPRIAAIGLATAREIEQGGDRVDVVAAKSDSEGLARALEGRVRAGERVLLVRPEVARAVLPQALATQGARVDAVAFYRNRPAPALARIAAALCAKSFDLVLFSSPSSLSRLLELDGTGAVRQALSQVARVAIGASTAEALGREGLAPSVSAEGPEDAAVVRAVLRVLR